MKRFAFRGLLFVLLLSCSAPAWAYNFSDDSTGTTFYYTITSSDDLTVEVASGDIKYSGDVVIPSTVEYDGSTYSVTGIGASAFVGCTGLTSVQIPSCVTSIGDRAFNNCYSLTSLEITGGVTSIGNYAFQVCSSLTSVKIPGSVKSIGTYAFSSCFALTTLELSEGLETIDSYAFAGCSSLTSVDIPNSVTTINQFAFDECSGLEEITIGEGLHSATMYVFRDAKNVSVVNYNATSVSVGDGTGPLFGSCTIKTFNIGANVTKMRSFSIYGCTVSGLYSFNPEPPELENNAFQGSTINVLYVPAASEDAYATADELSYTWDDIDTLKTFHLLDVFAKDKEEDEVGYGYATFYDGNYPFTVPDNLTGYTVVVEDGEANFNDTYESGEVVPANTAVLLYGQLCEDCLAYVKYDDEDNIDEDAGTAPTGNQLYGSFDGVSADEMAAMFTDGDYLFYKFTYDTIDDSGFYTGMRFYWGAENGGTFDIDAKRAWLAVPASDNEAKISDFYLDDFGTTGIRSVDSSKPGSDAIYNMQGIRVNDMNRKGIYIVGGKKVIKK